MNSKNKSTIRYSPETTDQVMSDEESAEYNGGFYSSLKLEDMFEADEVVDEADGYIEEVCNPITQLDEGKQFWSEGAIKLMLASVESLQPLVGKTISVKTKSKMYALVAERMAEANYPFTATQIENKFRGMERQYKKTVLKNRATGRNSQTSQFEKELEQVLRKKKGFNSAYTLESQKSDGKSGSVSVDDSISGDVDQVIADNIPSCSSQGGKRRKIEPKEGFLKKLDKIIEEKREFHMKVLEHWRKKDEMAEKKLRISERKLELLEKIANSIK